jgi:prophage regulatory protein
MPDNNHIICLSELLHLIPFSRSHIYRLEKTGQFPRRLKLGMRRVGWRLTDISKWISERAEAANACRE